MSRKAFSLIELSIVILIIGILIAGVTQSSRLINRMRIATAASLTKSSPVPSIQDLAFWVESTSEYAFAMGSAGTYTNILEPDDTNQIARWNDINPQSTTKYDAIQSTLANQPTYKSVAINNLPALLFSNPSAMRLISSLSMEYTTKPNLTYFIVFQRVGNGSYQCIFGNGIGGSNRIFCPRHADNATQGLIISGSSSSSTITGVNGLDTEIVSVVLKNTVSSGSTAYVNGTSNVTFTDAAANNGAATTTIGADGPSAGAPWDGYISEVIIYSRALKTEERKSVEKYLGQKWGVKIP